MVTIMVTIMVRKNGLQKLIYGTNYGNQSWYQILCEPDEYYWKESLGPPKKGLRLWYSRWPGHSVPGIVCIFLLTQGGEE